ncbi:DUF3667 domain-containing protein [Flavobacterium sp. F-65]|uniref:DUF3667 domain-containing protein n=1 Tax=Flavobacterium pisciphilum TaxID=2893755 RepID=A0ABS8MRT9_9FLAO|nr:DUF3667 domain-containing protein [Flavobacterium sp. F-65]MCC9071463.1 DUF3667 domain-containing protein [Flavobacterium sp. F-65]
MNLPCKNCDQDFTGNYCNNCGQSTETHRLNFHFLWHDIQHGLFHFDKGVLYTAKQLLTRPGASIREFLEGKRVKHFKPLSLVIILATIYGLLYHSFHINIFNEVDLGNSPNEKVIFEKINEWMSSHFAWATLITIPFYALATLITFRKQGYNFIEHLVLNSFLAAQRLIVHITTFPLIYIYNGTPSISKIMAIITFIDFALMIWGYTQFFNKITKVKSFLLSILSYIIFFISIFISSMIIGILVKLILKP